MTLTDLCEREELVMNFAAQLDAAGLLPPWVRRNDWRGIVDTRTDIVWRPEKDYRYAFWLLEHCGLGKYGLPLHSGLEDIPRAIIKAALVVTKKA